MTIGTGKTVLLTEIIKKLRDDLEKFIAITASTGIASVHIGGSTLHSFAGSYRAALCRSSILTWLLPGVGLGSEPAENLFWKVLNQPEASDRWKKTETLIIDESEVGSPSPTCHTDKSASFDDRWHFS